MIDNIFLMLKNPTKLVFFPHGYVSAKIVKKKNRRTNFIEIILRKDNR